MRALRAPGLLALLTIATPGRGAGQASPAAAEARAALEAAADDLFAPLARPGSPGCAVGIERRGERLLTKGYGLASLEWEVPITSRTVFDVASVSKQVTATAVLLLEQDGLLSLDDDVRKHLPELPPYPRTVTLRHLLHHTSGLRDYLDLLALKGVPVEGVTTDAQALALIARQKGVDFPAGEEMRYCNTGYFLLSQVVRRVSGKSLRVLAAERVFGPLGMKETRFADDHAEVVPRRATGYAPRAAGGFATATSGWEQTGDGGVLTTLDDLLLWGRALDDGSLAGRELVERMETAGKRNDGSPTGYGLGVSLSTFDGRKVVFHAGSWTGFRAALLRVPSERLDVAVLCNLSSTHPDAVARALARIVLDPAAGVPAPPATPGPRPVRDLTPYPGLYRNVRLGTLRRVYLRDARLRISRAGSPPSQELVPNGPDEFVPADSPGPEPPVRMRFEPGRKVPRLTIVKDGVPETYEAVPSWTPAASELGGFTGTFTSDELEMSLRVALEEGRLFVRARTLPAEPLEPTFPNAFALPGWQVAFTRDGAGRVESLTLRSERLGGIRFVREAVPAPTARAR